MLEDLFYDKKYPLGTKFVRNNEEQLHSTTGPAVLYPDGTEEWYFNGFPHRGDGPAVVTSDGKMIWYWHGARSTFNKWCERAKISNEEALYIKLLHFGK